MISKLTIDKVFEAARVEEVIGDFVHLKKAGSNYKGLSPFTDEKTPSFVVSPVKQIWKDFSTGKGGNAVSFLMEFEHYTYPEALRYLAKKYGIEIEETEQSDEEKAQASERESMFLVSEFAKKYFQETLLNSIKGKAIGLSYFRERGFTDETIEKFELGYCLDEWTAFTDRALKEGYNIDFLEKTGLTIVKGEKRFDRFKARVMFPIHSMSGRVLGFGGRILTNDKKAAKYLNSPESEVYHKSHILYGLYQAKQAIVKEDNCYLVEGYTDVISFSQKGVENVVASSGTALTPDQIRLIRRLTPNITILFDGDAAGIRASFRGIDLILEQGMNVRVVMFPEGEDPDSFSRQTDLDGLKTYLSEKSQDFINFKVSLLLEDAQNDPVKKASLIREIVVSISKIPDLIQREVYVQECANIMNISEEVLFNELAQLSSKSDSGVGGASQTRTAKPVPMTVAQEPKQVKIDELSKYERNIIKVLLLFGQREVNFIDVVEENGEEKHEVFSSKVAREVYLQLQEDEIGFSHDIFQKVYQEVINFLNQDEDINIEYFISHPDPSISSFITDVLMEEERYALSDWSKREVFVDHQSNKRVSKDTTDTIMNIRRILIDKKIEELRKVISTPIESHDDVLEETMNYIGLRTRVYKFLNRVM